MNELKLNFSVFKSNKFSKHLCVLIHGYGSFAPLNLNAKKKLNDIEEVIKKTNFSSVKKESELINADIYFPDINKETSLLSTENPNIIVIKILEDIETIWQYQKYDKIYLIGYSMGALLARKVYICACGETKYAFFEEEFKDFQSSREWANKVERIILLGGINRGWSINHHLSLFRSITWTLGAGLGNLMMLFLRKTPIIFKSRKGASFITQLRIQWIYMRREASVNNQNLGKALTIQLLGTKDDFVSPEDTVDPITGNDFIYLEVPYSNHFTVVKMKKPTNTNIDDYNHLELRGEVFLAALTEEIDILEKRSQPLISNVGNLAFTRQSLTNQFNKITDVIFVIHGIRDEGHWTNKIAQRVLIKNKKLNENRSQQEQHHFAIETSRYDYFPMLSFILPWKRRAKVAWFMDRYAENLVLYPEATFSFIGHSNGTYLLAQAIKEYECCKFKRVVFAGSVVPKNYLWSNYIETKRIEKVLNYVATFDWVVAIFPNFLHWFQKDLGSAGHDGFKQQHSQVENITYIRGQHNAALSEYNWDAIANFIVEDSPDSEVLKPPEIYQKGRCNLLLIIDKVPWIIWLFIIFVLVFCGYIILFRLAIGEWQKTLIFVLYLAIIKTILTKI